MISITTFKLTFKTSFVIFRRAVFQKANQNYLVTVTKLSSFHGSAECLDYRYIPFTTF